MKNRFFAEILQKKQKSRLARIVVLTGARQTGKTTLTRHVASGYAYVTLDDPVTRPEFTALSAAQWSQRYPKAVLDEVQKTPSLIETIKAAHDLYPTTRYILLGSSQILLLHKVRESLAGRVALLELFPLTLPELQTNSWDDALHESRLIRWLRGEGDVPRIFAGIPLSESEYARAEHALDHYLTYGGLPAITEEDLDETERREWLRDYIRTFLQRDLRDLANLRELEPFVSCQKMISQLTGCLLNANSLAQAAGISQKTARRFISYLEISYQVLLLPPWSRNPRKRLMKTPKLHFLDPGVQRAILDRRGEMTGREFESAVVAEIYKQVKTAGLPTELSHLLTADGREVDLLLESEDGYVPIEIKHSLRVGASDARSLRGLDALLDKPVRHSFLLSRDPHVREIEPGITALPVAWALG
ncbi:MAG: ATP-binding protein [Armatimonadetes bacterium]|nr:ATP-binding protein [Armatimonadota bacterium]